VVRDVLETIQPLLTASNVAAQCEARGPVPAVFAPVPIWRQAVLGIVNLAIYSAPGGRVHITLSSAPPRALIRIQAFPPAGTVARAPSAGDLETAWQLLELCHGELEVDAARDAGDMAAFAVTLSLPAAEQITVLVVDDNADTRLLLQRYLSGTRYHFAGAHTSQQGMALAEELSPRVIVLDVMMPKQDGWALLGYLREHPKLRSVPVVVTTILAEEKLALALGAADFMRKPIKRSELLAVLDRHLSAPQPESG
jgi:CheY-like chemotaxis protein